MTLQHTFVPEEEIQKVNQIWGNPIGGYFFQGAVGGGGGGGISVNIIIMWGGVEINFCLMRGGYDLVWGGYFTHFPSPPPP